ncbi:ribosome small subunit-dependent GTPase A [Criblamydia sequanensis]|uniref:Small ribosomal subunit biogenesis GTPase RsgA n=1 Tax=Candidatus Criblamydia sequanensis CRIB-18 TaxID=1437425 RepID=A0A090CZU3_9BACT|nr:ribosome small subunit-dependent GTPase A [Criblamydia sequanensis]CDR34521.1 Putative ribosome biogenesis GTPase [Criblamydia sequanensis CRIB-18]
MKERKPMDEIDPEELYFGKEPKKERQEKKRMSLKDRSKFKKTDQDQLKKSKERGQEARMKSLEEFHLGRVLSIRSQEVDVDVEGKLFRCKLRGSLKKDNEPLKNLVAVGDLVRFELSSPDEGSILSIEPRKTILSRADNLSRRKEQIIASNVDQVLITVSVVLPPLKSAIIDRYIIASEKGGMKPIIVVNKIDLLEKEENEGEKEFFELLKEAYEKAKIPLIAVSAATQEGLSLLKKVMKDKTSVFSGQSGVGKSSLINQVTGLFLPVGEPVLKTKKGGHTTTQATLLPLEEGGFVIDTPGIKSFGLWSLKSHEIQAYFNEIQELAHLCKFPDCTHTHEANCAVIQALEEGKVSPIRYDSYVSLIQSCDEKHERR